ncbi:MAG: hypothetical protein L0H53_02920 [Candidatus Nitrosocosmicus sp.]|nr:hypothetical protein [Candidatus Nitrosocosmicus sp.]MDN5866384.1 hypothetical protein [Candidatus Nitrosocosmicus sp.]
MGSLRYNSTSEVDQSLTSNTPFRSDGARGYTVQGYPSSPQNGFLVFVDALGMRRIWENEDPNVVFNKWKDVITRFNDSVQQSPIVSSLKYFNIVSDTIIMSFSENITAYDHVFGLLQNPFKYSLGIKFPLRGAISHDVHYLSNLLAIGPAIADAASVHDQIEMIGIFTTPELTYKINKRGLIRNSNNVILYPQINIKQNRTYSGLALNWYKGDDEKILLFLSNQAKCQSEKGIKDKYLNTMRFCKYNSKFEK